MKKILLLVTLVSFEAGACYSAPAPDGTYVNFEGAQTNPIRLSPDNSRLFVVNTPDARLSVFDVSQPGSPKLLAEIPVGIEPVSVNARTNDEAWVVNEESDSVSIVSVSRRVVIDTIVAKDEPMDVVFAASYAFVTCSRSSAVNVYDVSTHALVKRIPLFGDNPRAMAVSADGTKVFVAFALSGNKTTLVPKGQAPPPPPPQNPDLPPAPQVSLIVNADDPDWSGVIHYNMPDKDVAVIDVNLLAAIRYFSGVGTINLGIAIHPKTEDLYIANTDARNLIQFEPNLKGHVVDNRVTRLSVSDARTFFDLNPGIDYDVLPNPEALANALAQPTALTFDKEGANLFVAAFGTDRIGILDPNGNIVGRIEIGPSIGAAVNPVTKRGPRGLALHNPSGVLYVMNRISNSISLVNVAARKVVREIPVGSYDPTSTVIRNGRGFLYDAKLSGNGTVSCASCHVDAENDHLAWIWAIRPESCRPSAIPMVKPSSFIR